MIFEKMAIIEKKHTVNEETTGQFIKILMMQFMNIALVVLIVNMKLPFGKSWGLPIFNGDYVDFDSGWYENVGKTICLTMVINIFSPHASKLVWPLIVLLKRCLDRGCSRKLLTGEMDTNDKPTSKLVMQEDLNELYTGHQISSHYVYA